MRVPAAIFGFVGVFVVWSVITSLMLVDAFLLPGPLAIVGALAHLVKSGHLLLDVSVTMGRVGLAFALATVIGLPLGLMLGCFERLYRMVEVPLDLLRSTPATALFPLSMLLFGVTDASKVLVAATTAGVLVVFQVAYGVLHGRPRRVLAARLMGASGWQIVRHVVVWEALPQAMVGLRSALSLSLVVIVVTEMFLGTSVGLGRRIIDAQITYEIPAMYAVILLTGVLGYACNLVFVCAERRFIHWTGR
jgi:sulfonate transport system permease protein